MSEKRTLGKMQGRATLIPASFNPDENTIDVVFATEVEVMRRDYDGLYREVLACESSAVRLDRLNAGGAVIDSHNAYSVTKQFGVVVRAWIDEGTKEAKATIKLSQRDEWKGVVGDILAGIIRNVSVGYNIYKFLVDDSNQDVPPIYRAIDWEPTEISFTPVPADYNSGSRTDSEQNQVKITMKRNSKDIADIYAASRAAGLTDEYAQSLVDSEATREAVLAEIEGKRAAKPVKPINESEIRAQERTRITEIRKAARIAGVEADFVDTLIDNGVALEAARAQIIDKAAESNAVAPRLQTSVTVSADEKDKKTRGMESSILQRAGIVSAEVAGDPGQFRGMTLMDLAKEALTESGVNWRGMSQRQIATRALQMSRDGGGGLASGDFSYVLQNVLNKTLRTMYDLQERTFTPWTRKSTASDFKNILRTQLNDLKLSKVSEGGEYSFAQAGDTGEVYKVSKYGKIVNIDWEAIVNDDLSAFSRYPQFLAGAVAQLQSDLIYAIITGPHVMGDGNQLFDAANHNNYTSVGTDISVTSLGIGRKQMRQQKTAAGNVLNITPKFLVCGPNKEQVALQYTSQNYVATKNSDINVWVGMMQPIIDARIPDNSWFLVANPGVIDTIEYATLDGQDIYTESRYGFDVDALQWKVRTVFGAKAIEWRSIYKNAGA